MSKKNISEQEIQQCISFLQMFSLDPALIGNLPENQRIALMHAAGQISRPDRSTRKKVNKAIRKTESDVIKKQDRTARALSGIRTARIATIFESPKKIDPVENPAEKNKLSTPRNCYICKVPFQIVHHFYDDMCTDCGDFNYAKRFQSCDLSGQVALITGSRLKIGYQATLMMLRAGATVIATTRFPVDSASRYAKEEDFQIWSDRLHIHGLDLRHLPSVELFTQYILYKFDRLDILINNAAQTVRRPVGFYAHLMPNELLNFESHSESVQKLLAHQKECIDQLGLENNSKTSSLSINWQKIEPGMGIRESARLSQIPYHIDDTIQSKEIFPQGKLDADLQQVDLRNTNSWRLRLGEIETAEMIEVQLVNAMAPFILINKLIGLMRKQNTGKKHIVNVTAMEGKFYRWTKSDRHPHTNMAKAALNMMTHTSASDFAKDGIYMNAVDTGWITDEDPVELAKYKTEVHDFQPPLDIVDGAARVCDPFIDGILTGKHWCGKFLKDYNPIDW